MRNVLVVVAGLGATFALGLLLFNFVIMPRLVQHNVSVRVPHVVGLDVDAARRACEQTGLQLLEDDRRHSEGVEAGRVLTQAPPANTAVKRGRTVRVLVSLGNQIVAVPEVRGMTLRQATLQLENASLQPGRVARIHAGTGGQIVRATRPRAGSEVAVGDSVDLLVETGDLVETFLMPNLTGQDLVDVRHLVESRGFRVGRVTYRGARGVYPGTVLQQYPESGALVRKGDAIDLVAATPD